MPIISTLWSLLQHLFFVFIGIFGIGFIIGFHELGHFLFCKLFNISTPSFSIGFGPKIISKKIGETEFSLSAIPLGGYVEIAGNAEVGQGDQNQALRKDERSFSVKPFYQKLLVMIGGIGFNLIFAYIVIIGVHIAGAPQTIPVIKKIVPDSPAEKAGLQIGDRIRSVTTSQNEQKTDINNDNIETLLEAVRKNPEQTITLFVDRSGETSPLSITATPGKKGSIGFLGVEWNKASAQGLSLKESIKEGIAQTNKIISLTTLGILGIFKEKNLGESTGPLGLIYVASQSATEGMKALFYLLAIISIGLAVLNLVPLPVFDGGQILFFSIEALIGRSLPARIREYIHIVSWVLILILMVWISIKDIRRIGEPYFAKVQSMFTTTNAPSK